VVDAFALLVALRFYLSMGEEGDVEMRLSWIVILVVLWFVVGIFMNVYDLTKAADPIPSMWSVGEAAFITTLVYIFIPRVTPALPERRLYMFLFPLMAMAGVIAWRFIYAKGFVQPAFQRTSLVIGAGFSGKTLAKAVSNINRNSVNGYDKDDPLRRGGYCILGFVDDDPKKMGREIEGVPVLGTSKDLTHLVRELRPDEVVIAITHSQRIPEELFRAILDVREQGIPITTMANLYEHITGKVPVEHARSNIHVVFPVDRPLGYRFYLALRRLFDVLLGVVGCLLTFFMVPVVWVVNRFTDPGDVFYQQERVGKGGKPFQVVKFRSMVMNAEEDTGAIWADKNDPRVTPMGKLLRRTRLDELPQFWNVLKGEMSVIGPRPERPEFISQLDEQIPFYRARHAVKPGITGWAQIKYRYGASVEDALIKLQYDLYYIKHMGPFLDLQIIIRTLQVMLGLAGR
jgi:exopolysaccharide biosynthesis polyprenyl glycosylphosphotransferase